MLNYLKQAYIAHLRPFFFLFRALIRNTKAFWTLMTACNRLLYADLCNKHAFKAIESSFFRLDDAAMRKQ